MRTARIPRAYRRELMDVATWAGQNKYSFNEVIVELARQGLEPEPDEMEGLEEAYRAARWPKARAAATDKPYTYSGWSCPSGPPEFVNWLVGRGEEISYREFIKHVDKKSLPLDKGQMQLLPKDWSVTFLQTELPSGKEAYVMQHGGIEHLCLPPGVDYYKEAKLAPEIEEWLTDTYDLMWGYDASPEQLAAMREHFFGRNQRIAAYDDCDC